MSTRPEGGEIPATLVRAESPGASSQRPVPKPRAKVRRGWRSVYLKQLHLWHWVSAAVSLVGMLLFAVTGITLNHAATIGAEPQVVTREAQLPNSLLRLLSAPEGSEQPLPAPVAAEVEDLVDIGVAGRAAEWSPEEVYVAAPGPGSDAWVSIDRASGAITAEAPPFNLASGRPGDRDPLGHHPVFPSCLTR